MKGLPAPLTWPSVVPLEVACRYLEAAHRALDSCVEEQPQHSDPAARGAAMQAALDTATQASALEHHMRLDAPGRQ